MSAGAPPLSEQSAAARRALVELGRRYHRYGWLYGTSGNLSTRVGPNRVVITASGRDKGALSEDDFVEIDLEGELLAAPEGARPSAETSIHLALYDALPAVSAVLHVHTVATTLARPAGPLPAELTFSGLEMIKGWGLWEPDAVARLPVFANHAHVPDIADEMRRWYQSRREVPAALIAGHGLTAWGESLAAAHRHVEITEFLCQVLAARQRTS